MSVTSQRKLTTILCADVAGYSRLMGKDEEGTLDRLKKARIIFSDQISEYAGRIVNMTGDGLVADFSSVVQAVHCAVSIQKILRDNNAETKDPDALIFRIGLNLGDVIIEGDDIFGDGVNVAARLEAIAPKGGICISGTVYDHVKGKVPDKFSYLGEKLVKNIEDAIPIYSLSILSETPETSSQPDMPSLKPQRPTNEVDLEEEMRAQIKRQAGFYRRAISTAVLITFLMTINLITSTDYLWFVWPAMPLIFILVMDAIRIFGKGYFVDHWEERHLQKVKARQSSHPSKSENMD